MEKMPMCRVCLAENVRMFKVVNRNLHELYEKLTDIPFVTEDSRPILACFFCYAKLKQSYQLQRQCLKAEELFAQMMNEDYEPNPLISQAHLELFSGLIKSPTEHISIDDEYQTESTAIKEELPAVCEREDDVIELKKEHQSYELEVENSYNSWLDVTDIPPHHSESDLEDDIPLMELKIEVEGKEVSKKLQRARDTERATIAKKPKLDIQRTKLEDVVKNIRTTQKLTSKPATYLKERNKCNLRNYKVKKNVQHTDTQTGEKPKCDVCQRSFNRQHDLNRHIFIHTGEKPYKCEMCQRNFSAKYRLTAHIRIHTGEKPYKCNVCQRRFSKRGSLRKHIRIHTGEKPYTCNICQRSFSQKGSLIKHIRIHTGEKPYTCKICQRSFSQKDGLVRHIRIHTGEKPYKCNVCQRRFSGSCSLRKHIRIHTGEKPYTCNICQRSFSQNCSLIKHIRIHTGEKPYKCDVCQSSFIEKNHLTKHIRIHWQKTL